MQTDADLTFEPGRKKLYRMGSGACPPMLTAHPYQEEPLAIWEVIAGHFVLRTDKTTAEKSLWVLTSKHVFERLAEQRKAGLVVALYLPSGDTVIRCEAIPADILEEFGQDGDTCGAT